MASPLAVLGNGVFQQTRNELFWKLFRGDVDLFSRSPKNDSNCFLITPEPSRQRKWHVLGISRNRSAKEEERITFRVIAIICQQWLFVSEKLVLILDAIDLLYLPNSLLQHSFKASLLEIYFGKVKTGLTHRS